MRFLIVDEDCENAAYLIAELAARSLLADHCPNAPDVDAVLKANGYDGIVLSQVSSDDHPTIAIRELRLLEPDLPILVLGAVRSQDDCVQALDSGADDYLAKPCSISELVARLKAVTRRSAPKIRSDQALPGIAAAPLVLPESPPAPPPAIWR